MIVSIKFREEEVARLLMKYNLEDSGLCPRVSLSSEERMGKKDMAVKMSSSFLPQLKIIHMYTEL